MTPRICARCAAWAGDPLHSLRFADCKQDEKGPKRQGAETCLYFRERS